MGMYTQVRGWLNIDSISYGMENYNAAWDRLNKSIEEFQEIFDGRGWVANDTRIHSGGNGSLYIFFGTELKNYSSDAEEWIKFLISRFPSAEGRMDFQYEEEEIGASNSKYWEIYGGEVVNVSKTGTWCNGYGNDFK